MNKKTVSIITTVHHNIGDDFVREGIVGLLKLAYNKLYENTDISTELIHKHSPVTSYFGFESVRNLRASRIIEPILRTAGFQDRISSADILIQSGAPIYWCHPHGSHCSENEWFDPLVRKKFLKNRKGRKFLNIAGGSCQRYHSDGSELKSCNKCKDYIQEFFDVCNLTVLRDDLARKMLNMVGRDASVLPCSSIFARDNLGFEPQKGEYIVLNFMEGGGHFTFGQSINKEKWRKKFQEIVRLVKRMGKVVIACHNQKELDLAKVVAPDTTAFLVPDEHEAFMQFYARARFGLVNRVHSAFMMASFGKPSAVIGTDSRALMVNNLRLPSYFVEDVDDVESIVEEIASQEDTYYDISGVIRQKAREGYLKILTSVLQASQ